MTMQLDNDQLHKLLEAIAESDFQEFKLEGEDFRLEVRRNIPSSPLPAAPGYTTGIVDIPQVPTQVKPVEVASSSTPSSPPPAGAGSRADLVEITAPMVGTFYRAPAPGDPSFVELGNRIGVGQTVCILEAMKLMNELESEVSGEVVEILVENGTPVEFGQILMRVKPG